MQSEIKPARRRLTIVASALLLAFMLIIAYFAFGIGEDEDEPVAAASSQADVLQQEELAHYPVTIIIIDDFGVPLKSLVDRIDESLDAGTVDDFKALGDEIRALVGEKGGDGPAMRDAIIERVGPLKEQLAEAVLASPEMNLEGRALKETNCAMLPEGTAAFVTEGASAFVTEGATAFVTEGASLWDQPHGQRVLLEFEELLNLPQAQGLDIRLHVLDAKGFVFPVLAQQLDQEIKEIRASEPDMRFVVNMSIAIVPCEKVTDIVTYTRLLREFVIEEGNEQSNDPAAFSQVLGALYTEDIFHTPPVGKAIFQYEFCPGDEAEEYAACSAYPLEQSPTEERTLFFVGAAGNGFKDESGALLGVDYPFYPAAWQEVIAVSANNDTGHLDVAAPPRAEYSNAGRIIMGGTWPPGAATWPPQGVLDRFPQVGTSFAAPRYSFIIALYLANVQEVHVGCEADQIPPPADSFGWLAAPPPPDKIDQDHCSTLYP
jgi:hypothetical protein